MPFQIGTTLLGIEPLEDIFTPDPGDVFDPDWSFQPFATSIELADGTVKGQGFPIAKWRFNHISEENREVLKDFCPNLSALVYIETPTNESDLYGTVFKQYQAVMRWTDTDEDKAADRTLGMIITFTHLIEQS